jgi:hypothetical protein
VVISAADQERLRSDPDFILLRNFDFSADVAINKHPEGVPSRTIARALGVTESEVDRIVGEALSQMKDSMS